MAMGIDPDMALKMFIDSGALMDGHFKLSSGRHSDRYLQCARLLQYPNRARILCQALADKFSGVDASGVIAPAIGGILVAHELAFSLGIRAIFGERQEGFMRLRRGFEIRPGEKFILAEDVVTTGKSTREILNLVTECGGVPLGIAALADRSGNKADLPLPVISLITLNIDNWAPEECPLCKSGIPVDTPGSRFQR
ncbi:orotate phosphoribosyltransferase [bacterium]|nr:orotate phosphoribosyltransferase [candidate division CSSED10-310 bacterium]